MPSRGSRAGGDTTSFEAFYEAEFDQVLAMLVAMTGSWAVAEDLAQEAFARTLQRWPRVTDYERPAAWVRTVAANLARSRFRRVLVERRHRARVASPDLVRDPEPLPDDLERFWAAVRDLPRNQAVAVTLHYLEDADAAAVAEVLGCQPATARVHLHRARQKLQAALPTVDRVRRNA